MYKVILNGLNKLNLECMCIYSYMNIKTVNEYDPINVKGSKRSGLWECFVGGKEGRNIVIIL